MKKLSLAFVVFTLTACGSTAKNEVGKGIPQPQEGQSQGAFEAMCVRNEGGARGQLNAARTVCRRITKVINFDSGDINKNYVQPEGSLEHELLIGAQAGSMIFGSYEGSAMAPEVTLDHAPISRGNLTTPLIVDRAGDIRLVTYGGSYKFLNFSLAVCSSRGNATSSCRDY